jgi:hypothetical protein
VKKLANKANQYQIGANHPALGDGQERASASCFTLCFCRPSRDCRLAADILETLLEMPSSSIARLETELALLNESKK